ncbi:MAG: hypothetical protein ACW99Q_24065, partial [Candidatus Kariarchaeaceae archaeon]
ARINQLKSFEMYENTSDTKNLENESSGLKISLLDKIRSKDFEYLWENLLGYPFPFICELLKIFHEDNWYPNNVADLGIYETMIEQVGTKGWSYVNGLKWIAVSKKVGTKFDQLSDIQLRNRQFELLISPEIINRPDRIESKEVNIRGHHNLVNPDIDLHIYQTTIRKSDIDGLLHIPIYTNNGVEIAEFIIPAVSTNSFDIDEDGLYFTVRNPSGLYSVDIDALAAILLPVTSHSEAVTEIIPSLKEKAKKSNQSILNSLELLSSLHRGREFTLWNLKEKESLDGLKQEEITEKSCNCVLGLDIGDYSTKISYVPDVTCKKGFKTWDIPSLIHFTSLNDFVVGQNVINQGLEKSSQTFKYWKSGLYVGNNKYLRIRHTKISSQKAFEYFIKYILMESIREIEHSVPALSVAYSMELPLSLQRWIIRLLQNEGFKHINLVESLTSLALAEFKLANQRGNILVIDVGNSQMSAVIFSADGKKSRKRLEQERFREKELGKPENIAKVNSGYGSIDITNLLSTLGATKSKFELEEFNELKHKLAFDFETAIITNKKQNDPVIYSINDINDNGVINVKEKFILSDNYKAFKLMIRNTIAKASLRGLDKSKIEKIIISGEGANWPLYLEYIYENFKDKELLIEHDKIMIAHGAAIAGLGQTWEFKPERDYMLKITYEGSTHFESIIERGESIANSYKNFEIRQKARFEHVVLDCWSRIPKFVNELQVLPMKDTDFSDHRKSDTKYFEFDRIHRDLSKIGDETILSVNVSNSGKMTLRLSNDNLDKTIDLQTFIH